MKSKQLFIDEQAEFDKKAIMQLFGLPKGKLTVIQTGRQYGRSRAIEYLKSIGKLA